MFKGGQTDFLFIYFMLYTLIIPFGKFGPLYLGKKTTQQLQEQRYPVLQVHAGSFRVSVIHRTLTWTTGSVTSCVRDHSGGWAHRQRVSTFLTGKKITIFVSCAHDGAGV